MTGLVSYWSATCCLCGFFKELTHASNDCGNLAYGAAYQARPQANFGHSLWLSMSLWLSICSWLSTVNKFSSRSAMVMLAWHNATFGQIPGVLRGRMQRHRNKGSLHQVVAASVHFPLRHGLQITIGCTHTKNMQQTCPILQERSHVGAHTHNEVGKASTVHGIRCS